MIRAAALAAVVLASVVASGCGSRPDVVTTARQATGTGTGMTGTTGTVPVSSVPVSSVPVSLGDRARVLAAVAEWQAIGDIRAGIIHEVLVVDHLGHLGPDSFVVVGASDPAIEADERAVIEQVLAPATVRWIAESDIGRSTPGDGTARVALSVPKPTPEGTYEVSADYLCGPLCGHGGTYTVARQTEAGWIVTQQIGGGWIS